MAIQDILSAIIVDADHRINDAAADHRKRMKEMREESERALSQKRIQINEQREQKKRNLKEKAESHARMLRTKALLTKKQEYMDQLYADVLNSLSELPKEKVEAFLKQCLGSIHGKGVIRASKAHEALVKKHLPDGCEMGPSIDAVGGFSFESDTEEHDFTFEFLVNGILRPQTEISTSKQLFPTSN